MDSTHNVFIHLHLYGDNVQVLNLSWVEDSVTPEQARQTSEQQADQSINISSDEDDKLHSEEEEE